MYLPREAMQLPTVCIREYQKRDCMLSSVVCLIREVRDIGHPGYKTRTAAWTSWHTDLGFHISRVRVRCHFRGET